MNAPDLSIPIVAVRGSVRPGNYTAMALDLVIAELRSLPGVSVEVFDPAEMDLNDPGEERKSEDAKRLQEAVVGAMGVILSTPEYHGSYSSVIKRVIENLGFPSALRKKPIALLGVAAGRIGAIKSLEHLQGICVQCSRALFQSPAVVTSSTKAVTVPTRTSKRLSEDWEPT
jgi:NAD(P)H-dependent FMN reductase